MKKIITLLLITACVLTVNAQKQKFIDEAATLLKIKSFNIKNNTKKVDILTYIRLGNHSRNAKYYIELKESKDAEGVIFREAVDFNNFNDFEIIKSYRRNGDVYEFNFGTFSISEHAFVQLIIIDKEENRIELPLEFTNYNNPITQMN